MNCSRQSSEENKIDSKGIHTHLLVVVDRHGIAHSASSISKISVNKQKYNENWNRRRHRETNATINSRDQIIIFLVICACICSNRMILILFLQRNVTPNCRNKRHTSQDLSEVRNCHLVVENKIWSVSIPFVSFIVSKFHIRMSFVIWLFQQTFDKNCSNKV